MLKLEESDLLGKGRDRLCYKHPSLPYYCVKVSKHDQKQTDRELQYFHYLARKGKDTSVLAHFISATQTNKGEGAIFERVCNDDGSSSPTLTQYMQSGSVDEALLRQKLDGLKKHLLQELICVRDIRPNNIMCQTIHSDLRLVIVDGIGNISINPFNLWFASRTQTIIEKAWKKLESKLSLSWKMSGQAS